jgi:hypothetical protein
VKILIVAQARSGSGSLQQCISDSFGFPYMREPFSSWRKTIRNIDIEQDLEIIENTENIVVKVCNNSFYMHPKFQDENDFFALFDKVVGLTRESTYETVSSFLIATHFNSWHETSKDKIFSIKDYEDMMRDNFDFHYKETEIYKNKIKSFNIPQFTYEELYVNDTGWERLEDYLGIKLDKTSVFTEDYGL